MKRLVKMFMFCGISTFFWGVMFGGWFGDMFGISPAWFNPVQEPMTLLVFSLILGAIHLFVGMGLKAYLLIRNGQALDAVCDIFLWYLLLIGIVVFALGGSISPAVSEIGKWMTIVGVVGILITGGRHKKGIGKVTGGLGSLYGITCAFIFKASCFGACYRCCFSGYKYSRQNGWRRIYRRNCNGCGIYNRAHI